MTRVVTRADLMAEWERCLPWLEPAIKECKGTHKPSDVLEMVITGAAIFWPGKKAVAVTEIVIHPRLRQHHFWLCGGDMHEIVNFMLPVAEDYGRALGCTRFSTAGRLKHGRDGWQRVLASRGYESAWSICIKDDF